MGGYHHCCLFRNGYNSHHKILYIRLLIKVDQEDKVGDKLVIRYKVFQAIHKLLGVNHTVLALLIVFL
jgi:hypothetical protein